MTNAEYWRERFKLLEDAAHKRGDDLFQTIERDFRSASQSVQADIDRWYARFAVNNQITLAEAKSWLKRDELKEFRWTVQEYIKRGEENAVTGQWIKELENASARVHISRLESLQIQMQQEIELLYGNQVAGLDRMLRGVYSDGYYHTAFEIQRGMNVGYDLHSLNPAQLEAVVSRPWSTDNKTFRDRCWTNKGELVNTVQTQLTQGIIRGDGPSKAIQAVSDRFRVATNKAGRLIMTESAFISSQAQKDAFKGLDVEQYEIVATLDARTSEICQSLDGQVFRMTDYEPGVTAPPFHPWCRSCTCPYFDDMDGERAARKEDGTVYYVPANMTYPKWKETFVDGGSKDGLKEIGPDDKIEVPKTFSERIDEIRQDIAATGGKVTEKHLLDAGEAVIKEVQSNSDFVQRHDTIRELTARNKELSDKYHEIEKRRKDAQIEFRRKLHEYKVKGLDTTALFEEINNVDAELYDQSAKANREWMGVYNQLNAAKSGTILKDADTVKGILGQVRPMGSEGFNIQGHLNNSRSPMKVPVTSAYGYYPKAWVDASVKHGSLTPKKVDRGYYSHYNRVIAISGGSDLARFETAVHELGHRMERVIPGMLDAEKAFYARRTAGETLEWLGSGYRKDERSRKDKFIHHYMGKDYGGSAYELVSMGFEYAFTNPTKLLTDDDMARWIYGILTLL